MEDFLTKWVELEEEEDRLREAKRDLKDLYAEDIPLRALLTAVKVVRAQLKLHYRAKDSMPRQVQPHFEHLVMAFHLKRIAEKEAIQREAEALAREGQRAVPDMTTREEV